MRRFNMFSRLVSRLGLLFFFSLTACHYRIQDPSDPRFIVAEGAGVIVTQRELQEVLKAFLSDEENAQAYGPARYHYLQSVLVDQILSDKIILQRAAMLPAVNSEQVEQEIFNHVVARYPSEQDLIAKLTTENLTEQKLKANIHKTVLIQNVLNREAYHQVEPTEQEIETFYLQHQARFNVANKVRASRILVMMDEAMPETEKLEKRKIIDQARARVLAGEDFAKVAAAVSEDRYSAPQGGDIGFFQRGENEDQFDAVAFQTEMGTISPVFQTALGYQFLKVTDIVAGGKLDVGEARKVIADYLKQQKMKQEEQDYRQKLLNQAQVNYHFIRSEAEVHPAVTSPMEPGH